jgi:hypothetical protein
MVPEAFLGKLLSYGQNILLSVQPTRILGPSQARFGVVLFNGNNGTNIFVGPDTTPNGGNAGICLHGGQQPGIELWWPKHGEVVQGVWNAWDPSESSNLFLIEIVCSDIEIFNYYRRRKSFS